MIGISGPSVRPLPTAFQAPMASRALGLSRVAQAAQRVWRPRRPVMSAALSTRTPGEPIKVRVSGLQAEGGRSWSVLEGSIISEASMVY